MATRLSMKYTKFNEKKNPCNCLSYTDFIYSFIVCLSNLLNLLEMQTVIKQAICVSVLQMCCKYGNKQHVTKPPRKYVFLPKQPKENTEKITNLIIFYFAWLYDAEIPKLCHYVVSSIVFTNIPRSRNY